MDHGVSPRIVKGLFMFRVAQRVASAMSVRPARRRAPMARLRSAAAVVELHVLIGADHGYPVERDDYRDHDGAGVGGQSRVDCERCA